MECAVFVLLMIIPALLVHSLRYSSDRLKSLAEKQVKTLSATGPGMDAAIIHETVAKMRSCRFRFPTLALDWLTFMVLPIFMWIGVRLMDAGHLRSLWPWAVLPGCIALGLLSARSQSLCRRKMDGMLARTHTMVSQSNPGSA